MGALRDAILAADDLPRERIDTPEWEPFGAPFVFVQGLSGEEREQWERSLTIVIDGERVPNRNVKHVRARFAVRVTVDENGERIFEDTDIEALDKKSAAALQRIFQEGRRISGMLTPDELEAEGNPSMGDQEEPSSSDSP